ncbi:SHOCT-like domain-containing protein [Clostridium sp. Marseille-QA1073]
MNEEVLRITKMISENKITAEEGAKLIQSLNNDKSEIIIQNKFDKLEKSLKIKVTSQKDNSDKVNMSIPLKVIKAFGNSIKNIPQLQENGVDVGAIMEAIDSGIEGTIVDIKSENGDTVEVYIE